MWQKNIDITINIRDAQGCQNHVFAWITLIFDNLWYVHKCLWTVDHHSHDNKLDCFVAFVSSTNCRKSEANKPQILFRMCSTVGIYVTNRTIMLSQNQVQFSPVCFYQIFLMFSQSVNHFTASLVCQLVFCSFMTNS